MTAPTGMAVSGLWSNPTPVPESDLVRFDLALTVSAMRYISDLHLGRVNPRLFHFELDFDLTNLDLSEFLQHQLVNASDDGHRCRYRSSGTAVPNVPPNPQRT